jgi:hypothetical protein
MRELFGFLSTILMVGMFVVAGPVAAENLVCSTEKASLKKGASFHGAQCNYPSCGCTVELCKVKNSKYKGGGKYKDAVCNPNAVQIPTYPDKKKLSSDEHCSQPGKEVYVKQGTSYHGKDCTAANGCNCTIQNCYIDLVMPPKPVRKWSSKTTCIGLPG